MKIFYILFFLFVGCGSRSETYKIPHSAFVSIGDMSKARAEIILPSLSTINSIQCRSFPTDVDIKAVVLANYPAGFRQISLFTPDSSRSFDYVVLKVEYN